MDFEILVVQIDEEGQDKSYLVFVVLRYEGPELGRMVFVRIQGG